MDQLGFQRVYDCYGCLSTAINSQNKIEELIKQVCNKLNAQIIKTDIYMFAPQGISAYAIISASHIGIHTWPEYQYAAIDVFSCKGEIPDSIIGIIKEKTNAQKIDIQEISRGRSNRISHFKNSVTIDSEDF